MSDIMGEKVAVVSLGKDPLGNPAYLIRASGSRISAFGYDFPEDQIGYFREKGYRIDNLVPAELMNMPDGPPDMSPVRR